MKKMFSLIIVLLLSLSIASCNFIAPDSNNSNDASDSEFDTSRVSFTAVYSEAQRLGFEGTLDEFIDLISGKDGVDGKDGVGITSVLIDNNGNLLVILTNGNTINCGKVKGTDGKDGINGTDGKDGVDGKPGTDGVTPTIEISNDGYWVINGVKTEYKAVGVNGTDGSNGTNGINGITPNFKVENGELLVSYDNGENWSSLGYIQGADGENGTNGTNGTDGVNGKTPYIEDGYWYIDGVNTGVKAEGVDGADGKNGVDGVNGKDGVTPTIEISADGYWVINGVKTEYKAVADGSGSDTHPHSFSEWIRYTYDANTPCDAWLYYRICSACKDIEWKNGGYENHTLTTVTIAPTCVAQGYDENTCSVCGFTEKTNYTEITGHTYEETYSHSDSFHWLDCKHCDATTSYGEHNIDESGYCTVCDQPLAPTEGIVYDLSSDGTYTEVVGYTGTATKIVIADTYNGVPVTTIYKEAFKENNSITSVVIPDSIVIIGDYAFYGCSSLTSVTIGNGVTSVGYVAFNCVSNLDSVYITDIAAWCDIEFDGYFANPLHQAGKLYLNGELVTDLVIPEGVTNIGDYAFYNCDSLTSVTIPEV